MHMGLFMCHAITVPPRILCVRGIAAHIFGKFSPVRPDIAPQLVVQNVAIPPGSSRFSPSGLLPGPFIRGHFYRGEKGTLSSRFNAPKRFLYSWPCRSSCEDWALRAYFAAEGRPWRELPPAALFRARS